MIPFIDLQTQRKRLGQPLRTRSSRSSAPAPTSWARRSPSSKPSWPPSARRRFALSCGSGTEALVLPLMAWGIGPGDAVFCPILHLRGDGRGHAAGRAPRRCSSTSCPTPTTWTPPSWKPPSSAVKAAGRADARGRSSPSTCSASRRTIRPSRPICDEARPEADRGLRPRLRLHPGRQAPDPLGRRHHHHVLPGQAAGLLRRRRGGAEQGRALPRPAGQPAASTARR